MQTALGFLRHIPLKSFVGYAFAVLALVCRFFGVDIHADVPALTLATINAAQSLAALTGVALTAWGHVELAIKHAQLAAKLPLPSNQPSSVTSVRDIPIGPKS